MKIDDWRRKIDAIDTAMLHLLNLRTELALEVGRFKSEEGVALRVPEREREILNRLKGINPGPLDGEAIEKIYQLILDQSVRSQELRGFGRSRETGQGDGLNGSLDNVSMDKGSRGPRWNSRKPRRV
jgi:chorismate mutase-like protein